MEKSEFLSLSQFRMAHKLPSYFSNLHSIPHTSSRARIYNPSSIIVKKKKLPYIK